MHIIIFGGTGRTGIHVIRLALEKGYHVTAVARNPAALQLTHPLLTVVKGDVLQPETYAAQMYGQDAVISCTGTESSKPTKLYSQGVQNILAAMHAAGIKRIMCISADAVVINPKLPLLYRFVAKNILWRLLKNPFTDLLLMEKILEHSDTEWTVVRPPQLTNKPLTGKYRFIVNGFLERSLRISRANVAHFFVNNILNTVTYRAIAEVAE
ncbi:MAG TPA: SDR family oxidoreductase [Chitinophagaceae bacterium]|nr:SDR family oxidoreductase [Chitinophagaceae bacterium]